MTEPEAHEKLIRLCDELGWYMIIWNGHFQDRFVIKRNSRHRDPNIYVAVFEEFFDDKFSLDPDIWSFTIDDDIHGWVDVYERVRDTFFPAAA